MQMRWFSLGTLALCLGAATAESPKPRVLYSFEDDAAVGRARASGAKIERAPIHATEGKYSLLLTAASGSRASLVLPFGSSPLDLGPFGALAFDTFNDGEQRVNLIIAATDSAGGVTTGRFTLRPKFETPIALPVNTPNPHEMGMRGPAAIPAYWLAASDYRKIDRGHVASIEISVDGGGQPVRLYIDAVRLAPGITYDRIVDALGQFALTSWPGKLADAGSFARVRATEEAELSRRPKLSDRDEYGGWASGPTLKATGFFRAEKRNGKWWLVTPGGHLFFSFGINSITITEGDTVIEGREAMFQWLPPQGDPLADHFRENHDWEPVGLKIEHNTGRAFNFYAANLERKYGATWRDNWRQTALARLPSWGFNTIGNWSDRELWDARKVPYTVTIDPWPAITKDGKPPFAEVSSGNDYWKRMADPFDPRYAEALDHGIRDDAIKHRDDLWCLGYFVDNEMSWGLMNDKQSRYGLSLGTLAGNSESPAKQAFRTRLEKKYGNIDKLNRNWGTRFGSWREFMDQPFSPPGEIGPLLEQDLRDFSLEFARQYFRTVIGILKKYDPNHMYLGPRFAWHTRESVEACGEFCDVVSFNIYRPKVVPSEWKVLDGIDKPVLIGEFHMGALDRGMFHTGLVASEDQADRARMYQEYVRSVVDHPLMVGCHYFKYADEPLTGRPGDGENYNIGVVSVTDTPYPEFIEAARAVQAEAYQRRAR